MVSAIHVLSTLAKYCLQLRFFGATTLNRCQPTRSKMSDDRNFTFDEYRSLYKGVLKRAFLTKDDPGELTAHVSDPTYKCAMDQVFRDLLLEFLKKEQELLEKYVSFCIKCCRLDITTTTMPVVLLGDIFDSFTLDKCEKMFTYVEDGVNVWKEDLFFVACKNNLLRMCNDLLRRLSRSQNTIFCGRILLFLAKFFPFSERSGLNIVSEFNLDNITELGGDGNLDFKDATEEDEVVNENKKNNLVIDYNLYCKFWALQDYFRNPNNCYNKIHWKTFASHSSCVLAAFTSYKLEAIQLKNQSSNKTKQSVSMDVDGSDDQDTKYFAKFLTNQKLLELQLSDSNFRRCILVQFLILFQYLQSSVKFKTEALELKTDQSDWIKDTTELVYKLISETPPDGNSFAERVKHILKREELWNNWKNDGCPEFQNLKPTKPTDTTNSEDSRKFLKPRRKRLLGDIIKDYENQGKFYLGNNELTKLWNLFPNNLESCKGKDRDFLPSLDTYLADAIDQVEKKVTGDQRIVADENFGWRALRLLATCSPHFFANSNNTICKLPDYLEMMVKKYANDVAASKQTDQDSTEDKALEEQVEDDIKQEDVDQSQETEMQSSEAQDFYEESKYSPMKTISEQQLDDLCEKLQGDWNMLALKLGYKEDEILYFKQENATDVLRGKAMLKIYFQDDEDASIDGLSYTLDGLGLTEAASVLKDKTDTD